MLCRKFLLNSYGSGRYSSLPACRGMEVVAGFALTVWAGLMRCCLPSFYMYLFVSNIRIMLYITLRHHNHFLYALIDHTY